MNIEHIITESLTTFKPLHVLYVSFFVFLAHEKFGASFYIKRLLRIKPSKQIKLIDCFPCQGWWVTLALTLGSVPTAVCVYLILILIDRR